MRHAGVSAQVPIRRLALDTRGHEFECGEDYARHIEALSPTFCKVLVRYKSRGGV